MTDGRKSSEGVDGAVLVTNLAELDEKLEVKLLNILEQDESKVVVEFSFRNNGNTPVRVINLHERGALLIIDKEGFSYNLPARMENPAEVTVPEKAAVKEKFVFDGKAESMETVRLWGKEFKK